MNKITYRQLISEIKNLPQTWIPAVILELTKTAIQKDVFNEGCVHKYVKSVEDAHNKLERKPKAALSPEGEAK